MRLPSIVACTLAHRFSLVILQQTRLAMNESFIFSKIISPSISQIRSIDHYASRAQESRRTCHHLRESRIPRASQRVHLKVERNVQRMDTNQTNLHQRRKRLQFSMVSLRLKGGDHCKRAHQQSKRWLSLYNTFVNSSCVNDGSVWFMASKQKDLPRTLLRPPNPS